MYLGIGVTITMKPFFIVKTYGLLLSCFLLIACGDEEAATENINASPEETLKMLTAAEMKDKTCFLVANIDENKVVVEEGELCDFEFSPNSTFKIAIALMGYDAKILKTTTKPTLSFKQEYQPARQSCQKRINPDSWIKNSCIWYSREIIKELGQEKFAEYVKKFQYGNQDISGNPEKINGTTHAWLDSSLKISPRAQLDFIMKVAKGDIEVSPAALVYTEALLYDEHASPPGYAVYAKTGSGNASEGVPAQGWYIGFYSHPDTGRRAFVYYQQASDKQLEASGLVAKDVVTTYLKNEQKTVAMLAEEARKTAEAKAAGATRQVP